TEVFSSKSGTESPSGARYPLGMARDEDVTPVRMVHRANPYSDIPSLYDMYVQASAHQRPNERFGMEVFRNTANDPQAIPMDLPVGPDYVIGPGDGLEIDLWGGVSQRLFRVGGVTPRGSLRALKHYRGKQLVEEVDAYDLLLHGVRSDMRRLENGDTLLVPSLGPQVTVDGMVRRPAIYELHGESSLADVLELAGGILPTATLRHIEVQRVEAHEKRTMLTLDLSAGGEADSANKQLEAFKVNDSDEIHI